MNGALQSKLAADIAGGIQRHHGRDLGAGGMRPIGPATRYRRSPRINPEQSSIASGAGMSTTATATKDLTPTRDEFAAMLGDNLGGNI